MQFRHCLGSRAKSLPVRGSGGVNTGTIITVVQSSPKFCPKARSLGPLLALHWACAAQSRYIRDVLPIYILGDYSLVEGVWWRVLLDARDYFR